MIPTKISTLQNGKSSIILKAPSIVLSRPAIATKELNIQDILSQLPKPHVGNVIEAEDQTDTKKDKKPKKEEVAWTITPEPYKDLRTLLNHYLMLSKFRLTCKCTFTFFRLMFLQ